MNKYIEPKVNLEKIHRDKPIDELINFSVINIDKPTGPTSFDIDLIVKKELCLNKTSHFGTLDPMVTGVLPVALGRACRLMSYFIGKKKEYTGVMRIHKEISEKELKKEMANFIGKINQLPPVKSRVKREVREREIYSFDIIEISNDGKDILFKSEVQAGTYIRKLISDLGEKIGGAHMLELRRTKASIFEEKNSVDLYKFEKAVEDYKKGNEKILRDMLIPGEIVSKVLPVVQVSEKSIIKLYHGSPLFKEFVLNKQNIDDLETGDRIAVFCEQKLIGIFSVIDHAIVLGKAEFVLQPLKQ
ncbi:MAG TPA: RNA-guided pseudouridylation complex pseudouridine synthase subunit Cbf5 [Candidatus Paceibacterota bacterium]|nr:RNA-guided pseudouridylation complex pseudouridine synthase subunit Cbf5 [Candidatus Paceibacterota bacterium]